MIPEIGDSVRIIREGLLYSQYTTWAKNHGATGFKEKAEPDSNAIFKVISMGEHSPNKPNHHYATTMLYLIEDDKGKQFIFERNGIDFVARKPYFEKEEFEV